MHIDLRVIREDQLGDTATTADADRYMNEVTTEAAKKGFIVAWLFGAGKLTSQVPPEVAEILDDVLQHGSWVSP